MAKPKASALEHGRELQRNLLDEASAASSIAHVEIEAMTPAEKP